MSVPKSHTCDPPEWDGLLDQEVEEWTCPVCQHEWHLGWEESWDSVYRLWER
jgi:hypothetical protein